MKTTIALIISKTIFSYAIDVFEVVFDPPIKEWDNKEKGYIFYHSNGFVEFFEIDYYDKTTKNFGNLHKHKMHQMDCAKPVFGDPKKDLKSIGITLIHSSKELDNCHE